MKKIIKIERWKFDKIFDYLIKTNFIVKFNRNIIFFWQLAENFCNQKNIMIMFYLINFKKPDSFFWIGFKKLETICCTILI